MAEVIGVIASTAQLAQYCGQVWALLQDIKGSTTALKRFQQQVRELEILSESISRNEAFHTSNIQNLVESILASVSVVDPSSLLQRPWIPRTLTFLTKKGDFLDAIEAIEKKKSSLSLHMHIIETEILNDIKKDISTMDKTPPTLRQVFSKIFHPQWNTSQAITVPPSSCPSTASTSLTKVFSVPSSNSSFVDISRSNTAVSIDKDGNPHTESEARQYEASRRCSNPSVSDQPAIITEWINSEDIPAVRYGNEPIAQSIEIAGNALEGPGLQINGDHVEGDADQSDLVSFDDVLFHSNATMRGSEGTQINGLNLCLNSGAPQLQLELKGNFIRNRHAGTGVQVNGIRTKRQGGSNNRSWQQIGRQAELQLGARVGDQQKIQQTESPQMSVRNSFPHLDTGSQINTITSKV
ncbi:hypothetical protein MFRU_005g01460 [Monilinia fructicola]|uniref:Fungal N-terminal domain-containing protein n=1 Tax=Monilinia fructicola TaxID=38448 RepID=A0A5M9JMM5_MONFR|nr:hypothetical protein EYC84_002325 [Monilinia fructicola]KAG4033129.1 hypothetical protein MFRU_005g01460 [Monilinia fructicola]